VEAFSWPEIQWRPFENFVMISTHYEAQGSYYWGEVHKRLSVDACRSLGQLRLKLFSKLLSTNTENGSKAPVEAHR
jgi:hypothetical protein